MSEIERCPFCGGEAHIEEHKFWNGRTKSFTVGTYGVRCLECGVSGTQFHKTKEEAIEKWNTRKPMERIVERLEEKIELHKKQSIDERLEASEQFVQARQKNCFVNALKIVKEEGGIE